MSTFSDRAHENALQDTLYWLEHPPVTAKEEYRYGCYLQRNKEYCRASWWFEKSVKHGFTLAYFKLGYLLVNRMDCYSYQFDADSLLKTFLKLAKEKKVDTDDQTYLQYAIGVCYCYGLGVPEDKKKSKSFFEKNLELNLDSNFRAEYSGVPGSYYELGCMYRDDVGGCMFDRQQALDYFRKAYDLFYEDAIFDYFDLYGGPFEKFPYQRELKEGYSFKLGQFMRIARVYDRIYAYEQVAEMYRHGYPGDEGEEDQQYKRKAVQYEKLIEALKVDGNKHIAEESIYFPELVRKNWK